MLSWSVDLLPDNPPSLRRPTMQVHLLSCYGKILNEIIDQGDDNIRENLEIYHYDPIYRQYMDRTGNSGTVCFNGILESQNHFKIHS